MGNFEPSKFESEFSGFARIGLISAVFALDWPEGSFPRGSMGFVLAGEMAVSG